MSIIDRLSPQQRVVFDDLVFGRIRELAFHCASLTRYDRPLTDTERADIEAARQYLDIALRNDDHLKAEGKDAA